MIGLDWDTAAIVATEVKLKSFASRVRRNVLMTVGRKAVVPMLAALKSAEFPRVTGVLGRSFTKKVKAYASTSSMFAAAGARSRIQQVTKYKDYRIGQIRTWRAGQPKKGPKLVNPAKYFHLAGPQRQERLLKKIRASLNGTISATVRNLLQEEVRNR